MKNPNIVLVVIDALRAKNLGCYGAAKGESPHIDRMAEKGVLFEKAFATWNTTDQSLTAIMSGLFPRSHGITNHGDKVTPENRETFASRKVRLLASYLKESGYSTLAVDWMGRWFRSGFDFYGYTPRRALPKKIAYSLFSLPALHLRYMLANIGLLRIYGKKRPGSLRSLFKGARDVFRTFRFTFELARIQDARVVTDLALELLKEYDSRPFFLFLHYWDTHSPYNSPKKLTPAAANRSPGEALYAKYLGAVRYVDRELGRLVSRFQEEGILDDTLFIITSDHGESLREHEIFFDHHGLYDVTTHVPLILYGPRFLEQGKRDKNFVQHIDLVPTVMDLLGTPVEKGLLDGESLLPRISGGASRAADFVYMEESYVQRKSAVRTATHKYIMAPDGVGHCNYCQIVHGGPEELYDLRADPEENMNIAESEPELRTAMRMRLEDFSRHLNSRRERAVMKNRIVSMSAAEEGCGEYGGGEVKPMELSRNEKSQRSRKLSIDLPESVVENIERRIRDTDFDSAEAYIAALVCDFVMAKATAPAMSEEEDRKIQKRLRSLGYMD